MSAPRQIKLGMFLRPAAHHIAGWRHPDAWADGGLDFAKYVEMAKTAERGLFDLMFSADALTGERYDRETLSRTSYVAWIEPITAANYMAQVAPHDGTIVGIVSQGLAADQALGVSAQLKGDLREFNWIANVIYSNQLLVVWKTSSAKTFEDAKKREITIGGTGAGSASVQYPAFYNNVLGTKFKIVFGYPGGQHVDFAMERGEIEGRGAGLYAGWMASKPTWIPTRQIIPLIQAGVEKEPALPDVPLIVDQPVKPEDKPLLQFMAQASAVGRPLATTPGVPAERVAALRAAFDATIKDPEFIAAAAHENLEIRPMTGDRLQRIIFGLLSAPADVRERVKVALEPKKEQTIEKPPGQQ